jgi:predicted nucleic acid-binding protein
MWRLVQLQTTRGLFDLFRPERSGKDRGSSDASPLIPAVYAEWKRIVVEHRVSGVKVHYARLIATMKTHGVSRLLTFEMGDFTRYTRIEAMHPKNVAA